MQFLSSCMLNEELTATCARLPPQDLGLQGCFFDISLLFVRYTIERQTVWRSIVYLTNKREISKKHPWSPRSWGGKRAHVAVSSSFSMQLDKNCINLLAMVGLVASRRRGA